MTWPTKTDFVDGDVLTAAQVNNIGTNLNLANPTGITDGYVLTADGAGSMGWEAAAAGGNAVVIPTTVDYTGTSATINAGGSVSFSGVSSLSLNGVFSSTYESYVAILQVVGSINGSIRLRWRVSGTDNTTASSYTGQNLDADSTTVSASRSSNDYGNLTTVRTTKTNGTTVQIYAPNLAQETTFCSTNAVSTNSAYFSTRAVVHNQTVAYDGFTIYPTSGTLDGRITVYGMKQ